MGSGVAQLVERSLPIPEVRSLIPAISKIYIEHSINVHCIETTKIKIKEAGNGPFLKNKLAYQYDDVTVLTKLAITFTSRYYLIQWKVWKLLIGT